MRSLFCTQISLFSHAHGVNALERVIVSGAFSRLNPNLKPSTTIIILQLVGQEIISCPQKMFLV
jgi:hypothetical protein